ncbi:hypothetical protein [Cryptosporangium minutisporangium]|uniref:DUF2092 domain-containing protein n=1 Tax=Cryptosporangium minutisporangium TaxID=113569 RepID=A0ABP6T8X6_9ACTN
MSTELEEHLTAAMRTHVADARLTTDVVAAAARANSRRRSVRRGATALGGLTLAAAVAGVVAVSGTPTTSAPPTAPTEQTALKPARYVATEVSEAITRSEDKIEHSTQRYSYQGKTSSGEDWRDGVTGDVRRIDVLENGTKLEYAMKHDGDRVTTTTVDHSARTWFRDTYAANDEDKGEVQVPRTADEIKAALEKQTTLAVLGKETLDGTETLHLKLSGDLAIPKEHGKYELWVNAETYELVRVVAHKRPNPNAEPAVAQWDYTYLSRTEENLARFTLTPPPGYTEQAPKPSKKKPQG